MNKKILYIQYTNPAAYPPLEHSSRFLAQRGWQVLFLGTLAWSANEIEFDDDPNVKVKLMPFCREGWRQKLHYACFNFWVLVWTFWENPSWIYASDPLACPIGWLLSYRPGLKVIYHEHDSPGPDHRVTSGRDPRWKVYGTAFMRMILWARRKLATRSEFCILPNAERIRKFKEETRAEEVFCVWNCPQKKEALSPKSLTSRKEFWLFFHGSIVPSRLPFTVVEALADLPHEVKLMIAGYETIGSQGCLEQFREHARQRGLQERIKFLGTIEKRQTLLEYGRQCDIGLSFVPKAKEDMNLVYMTGASNKPFDYLACGLAVLVADLPDWQAMYVQPGYGLACAPDDPKSIVRAIEWCLANRSKVAEMGETGRRRILDEWNYEAQFDKVLIQLEAPINKTKSS